MITADVVVIGAGPTGVSAAWPLAQAGANVLLLEGGGAWQPVSADRPSLHVARGRADSGRWLFGHRGEALAAAGGSSPKIRTSIPHGALPHYLDANQLQSDDFNIVGALAVGGMSNIWGAGASAFTAADLREWPIDRAALDDGYRAVATRVGLSGAIEDDDLADEHGIDVPVDPPLPLGPGLDSLLSRYRARRRPLPLTLGRTRLAVLSRPRADRQACSLDNFCMWRCGRKAIYNAADDLTQLTEHGNVRLLTHARVELIRRDDQSWRVMARDRDAQPVVARAPQVIVAAGVLPTTRLVADAAALTDRDLTLLTTPSATQVSVDPARLGASLPERGISLGQLTARIALPTPDSAFATIFTADGLAAGDLASVMPLAARDALRCTRALASSLLITLLFIPGSYSRHRARVTRGADGVARLHVQGGLSPDCQAALAEGRSGLCRGLRALGIWPMPGGWRVNTAGSESHYAGTLPMGRLTTTAGEVIGAPGLFVADASTFPTLPAKPHTLTAMANAHRVGALLANGLH